MPWPVRCSVLAFPHRFVCGCAVTLAVLLSGCGREDSVGPSSDPTPHPPASAVSDGATGGNPHVYFLPPLVKPPRPTGTFDPTVPLTLTVCEWSGTACGQVVATFTRDARLKDGRVLLVRSLEHYLAIWHVRAPAVRGRTYRILAAAGTTALGHVDVRVATKWWPKPAIGPDGIAQVGFGTLVPIALRIEEGAIGTRKTIQELAAAEATLHVNRGDPAILTVPAGDGEVVQFIGVKDAEGLATRITAMAKFAIEDPLARDIVMYDVQDRARAVLLRTGDLVYFDYEPNDLLRVIAVLADGTTSLGYEQAPTAATTTTTATTAASRLLERTSALPFAPGTAALASTSVIVGIRQGDASSAQPYSGALVQGSWETGQGRRGVFQAIENQAGSGIYSANLPTAAETLTPAEKDLACQAVSIVGCEIFQWVGETACAALAGRIPEPGAAGRALFACRQAVQLAAARCDLQVPCQQITAEIDLFLAQNDAVELTTDIIGTDFRTPVVRSAGPPLPGVINIDVLVPPSGFAGIWRGTWTHSSGTLSGPFTMTIQQSGNRIVGVYDLSYNVSLFAGTVVGTSATLDPIRFGGGTAFITLSHAQQSLSGTEIDRYDAGGSNTYALIAQKQSPGVIVTSTASARTEASARTPSVHAPMSAAR